MSAVDKLANAVVRVCHCSHTKGWHHGQLGACAYPSCKCRAWNYSISGSRRAGARYADG